MTAQPVTAAALEAHARQVASVRASLLLGDSRAERHGVYANRPPRVIPPAAVLALPDLPRTS